MLLNSHSLDQLKAGKTIAEVKHGLFVALGTACYYASSSGQSASGDQAGNA